MSGWGCPHEVRGICHKVKHRTCDPGMKGCVLSGKYVFSNSEKNTRSVMQKDKVLKKDK